MANGPTRVCVFNVKPGQQFAAPIVPAQTGSNLIDIVTGCDGVNVSSLGPASYGVPVVLNPNGVIDPSLLNTGVSAIAGVNLSLGAPLVHLYSVGGVLTAEYAEAGSGSPPSPPLSAQGFLTAPIDMGQSGTIAFSGLFTYIDPNSEFSLSSVGQEVYLSAVTPGGITLTRPSSPSLDQTVGYVVAFAAPNVVTAIFLAGYNDFTRISGVAQISQGGTAATTGAQALINLIGGSPSMGEALVWNGSAWTPSFAAETSFTDILTGTNITAAMVVGSGSSLMVSGSGIVEANQLWGVLVSSTPPSVNQALIATSGTAASWQTISYSIISGTPQLPQTFTPTLAGSPPEYEYLTGYNATTGLFSSTAVPPSGSGVISVNGKVGSVVLTYSDVGADPAGAASTAQANAETYAQAVNTSGTAANLSGTPALPNGTTATTQTSTDNTTKLATTAFVTTAVAAISASGIWSALTGDLSASQVIPWVSAGSPPALDTGLSRGAAGAVYVGDGTAGDFTGSLKLKSVLITDTAANTDLTVQNTTVATISAGYGYAISYTINAAQVAGTLTNFPVLVTGTIADLRTTINGGLVQNANGYDLIFSSTNNANGSGILNF